VLISQLRDTLSQGWRLTDKAPTLLKAITVEHPLQPFSPEYVAKNRDSRLFTYAREWFEPSDSVSFSSPVTVTAYEKAFTLSLESLSRFLKAPVKTFCNNTLKFGFDDETITSEDNEPFGFNKLESYVLRKNLLDALQSETPDNTDTFLEQQRTVMARQGKLPLGGFAHAAYADIADPVNQAWHRYQALLTLWPNEIDARIIGLNFSLADGITVQLTGELINLRQNSDGLNNGLIHLTAQALLTSAGKIKYPNLLSYWVQHLAGCAADMNLQTVVMGSDSVIEIVLIEQTEAFEQLKTLVEAWYLGMQAPLPVACKTAFAWLGASPDKALDAAKSQYQGDDWTKGEVAYDAYLARFFPTFAHLSQATTQGNFETWADTLYRTAFTQINEQTAQDAQS
jgi:exodeoxyribonuclease V gamma subunit